MYGKRVATDGATGSQAAPGALLEDARRAIGREVLAGDSASAALERYTAWIDHELQRLSSMAGPADRPVALIALGGYGRRHLCPYSDIDLLVLFGGQVGEPEERLLRRLLHPLWDVGFVVGHQVREGADRLELEVDNPEFLLALMDARLVAGDAALHRRLIDAFHVPQTHARILAALQDLIDARYAQFASTLYQLEPDLK